MAEADAMMVKARMSFMVVFVAVKSLGVSRETLTSGEGHGDAVQAVWRHRTHGLDQQRALLLQRNRLFLLQSNFLGGRGCHFREPWCQGQNVHMDLSILQPTLRSGTVARIHVLLRKRLTGFEKQ